MCKLQKDVKKKQGTKVQSKNKETPKEQQYFILQYLTVGSILMN